MGTNGVSFDVQSFIDKRLGISSKRPLSGAARKSYEANYARDLEKALSERDAKKLLNEKIANKNADEIKSLKNSLTNEPNKVSRYKKLAENKGKVSGVVEADRRAAEQIAKQGKNGFFSKIGKAVKGKKGKAALIIGLAAAVGTGLYALLKSDKSNISETVESNEQTVAVAVSEENEDPAQQPVAEEPVAEQDETSAAQPVVEHTVVSDENTYTVKKGDNVWNIAKAHLKELHKSEPDYVPTNKEILEHTKKLLILNDLHYESDGYRVIIRPDDKLKLVA